MNVPPTKGSGSVARVIAEQFLEPLSSTPGEQIRQTLARAYIDLEAERYALREALEEIESFPISGYHAGAAQRIARAALERTK